MELLFMKTREDACYATAINSISCVLPKEFEVDFIWRQGKITRTNEEDKATFEKIMLKDIADGEILSLSESFVYEAIESFVKSFFKGSNISIEQNLDFLPKEGIRILMMIVDENSLSSSVKHSPVFFDK